MIDQTAPLVVKGLHVGTTRFLIVDGVDFSVEAGRTIAIVGESGSGKSVSARAMTGLLADGLVSSGSIEIDGISFADATEKTWRSARGTHITWLPQDPFTMLNPLRRVRDSIADGADRKMERAELTERLSEVGISNPDVLDKYPFQLSGGIRQRVGIACALSSDPRILIADEPTTALDVTSQAKVLKLLRSVQEARGLALVLITHDLPMARAVADRVYVMYAGKVVEEFDPRDLDDRPLHPYTRALLMSDPPLDRRRPELYSVLGSVPTPGQSRSRCVFMDRCEHAIDECGQASPPLAEISVGRKSACIRTLDLRLPADDGSSTGTVDFSDSPAMLRTIDVTKTFGQHKALRGVSIDVRERQIVGIVGESGSGKTTLSRIIAGLETADAGSIEIAEDASSGGAAWPVQMVFQDPSGTLNPAHTVETILRDAIRAGGRSSDPHTDVLELLSGVGLDESFARRKAASLSGGQRQRIAIARALAPKSKILLCDEPTSALDVMVQAQILNLLRKLRDELGLAMVFVTHDLAVARQMTDYLYVLRDGLCVEYGRTDDILDRPQHPYTQELVQSIPGKESKA